MLRGLRFPKWARRPEGSRSKRQRRPLRTTGYHRRLVCEPLEDRRLLTVWTVTNTSGDNQVAGSLPWAVWRVVSGDAIQFAAALDGQTITLATNGWLYINANGTKPISIVGPGADKLTVKAAPDAMAFWLVGTAPVSISGLTITGGSGQQVIVGAPGTNLSLANCTVSGATQADGIIAWGALTVAGCTVTGNAEYGINDTSSVATPGASLKITNSIISGNAGGIEVDGAVSTVTNCTIAKNSGYGIRYVGLPTNPDTMTVSGTEISGNSAGGVNTVDTTMTIADCTIADNDSQSLGDGGIGISGGSVSIVDSTIAENGGASSNCGGIDISGGTLLINDSTVVQNQCSASGGSGGIYSWSGNSVALANTIVAGNTGGMAPDIYGTVTANYCLVGNGTDPVQLFTRRLRRQHRQPRAAAGSAGQLRRSADARRHADTNHARAGRQPDYRCGQQRPGPGRQRQSTGYRSARVAAPFLTTPWTLAPASTSPR